MLVLQLQLSRHSCCSSSSMSQLQALHCCQLRPQRLLNTLRMLPLLLHRQWQLNRHQIQVQPVISGAWHCD